MQDRVGADAFGQAQGAPQFDGAAHPSSAAPASSSPPAPQGTEPLPGVAGQLLRVIAAPRPVGDGSYTVTVDLHPPSLGSVRATVVAGAGQVSVQLVPSTPEGASALRLALPELQSSLSANGQQAQVTLGAVSAGAAAAGGGSPGGASASGGGASGAGSQSGSQPGSGAQPGTGSQPGGPSSGAPFGAFSGSGFAPGHGGGTGARPQVSGQPQATTPDHAQGAHAPDGAVAGGRGSGRHLVDIRV